MNFQAKAQKRIFSTAELSRKVGDVTHAAGQGPVTITQHNKPRFVMMSYELFQKMNPQRSYKLEDIPEEDLAWFLPELEKIASGNFDYDE